MTTLPSDTCYESLKTHKYDKKGQELIMGILVMKITVQHAIREQTTSIQRKKYSLKYLLPNASRFSFHLHCR